MGVGVGRIIQPAARVPNFRIDHTRHVAQNFFDTPEAAGSEHSYLSRLLTRVYRVGRSVLIIHVGLDHCGSSVPDCSAAMYAAYQSAQLASRTPVRFSCSPCAASARRIAVARSVTEPKEVNPESMRPGRRVVIS